MGQSGELREYREPDRPRRPPTEIVPWQPQRYSQTEHIGRLDPRRFNDAVPGGREPSFSPAPVQPRQPPSYQPPADPWQDSTGHFPEPRTRPAARYAPPRYQPQRYQPPQYAPPPQPPRPGGLPAAPRSQYTPPPGYVPPTPQQWAQYQQPQYQPPYAPPPRQRPRRPRKGLGFLGCGGVAVIAVIVVVAVANSGGHTVQTSGGSSWGDSRAPAKTAGIGSAITLTGNDSGEKMDVTVTKVFSSASPADEFNQPSSGDRLYAVQFRLKDTGSAAYSDSPSNGAAVVDSAGQSYQSSLDSVAGCQSYGGTENIAPGATGLGCIVFEVPKSAKITQVQFTLDSGLGPDTGQWKVG